ncbi:hypothetical protein [Halomarina pelagica]|uniref:hypothetical protein n=1 Tax=Halomarina pelagica TaxID=2961599 RepID=UPI0020C46135|nr:hypothetical protein [Halomarina sp. BND7]
MNRRTVLGAVAGGLTVALTGCLGGDDSGGDNDENGTGSNGTDDTNATNGTNDTNGTGGNGTNGTNDTNATNATNDTNATDGGASSITGEQFQAQSSNCGQGKESASVTFPGGDQVKVTGVISGKNACHSARLGDVSLEGGTLTVPVQTYVPEQMKNATCSQCIVDIEYQASFTFGGEVPQRVVVTHHGEQVATGER